MRNKEGEHRKRKEERGTGKRSQATVEKDQKKRREGNVGWREQGAAEGFGREGDREGSTIMAELAHRGTGTVSMCRVFGTD